MTIALFAKPSVLLPLQGLYRWLTGGFGNDLDHGLANPLTNPPVKVQARVQASGLKISLANGLTDGLVGGSASSLLGGSARLVRPMQRNSLRQASFANKSASAGARPARDGNAFPVTFPVGFPAVCPLRPIRTLTPRALPPVRMIRVREAGQARSSVGRMVISGRMADVCAELDRLAAFEAALH